MEVPPKRIPYFKPGKELKQFINDAVIPGIDDLREMQPESANSPAPEASSARESDEN